MKVMKDKVGFAILELSSNESDKVTGRTRVKFVIHEIFNTNADYNKNGISWNEQYTLSNIDSGIGLPICVEFIDYNKSEPFGHGLSGIEDNKAYFEYSTMVGVFDKIYVDSVTLSNGKEIRALIGEGYINEQRYPKFVQWLKAQKYDNKIVESSVEISKKAGHDAIIYDGGWKEKGRIPQIYDYTGHAIVGIDPADDSAVLLELNHYSKKKEDNLMNENEKLILELNNKIEAKNQEIFNLSATVQEKDKTIAELNTKFEEQQKEIDQLNEGKAAAEQLVVEINTKATDAETELTELRKFRQEVTNKELVLELNTALETFTDEEKLVAKEKIESFAATPSKDGIASIVSEINTTIVQKLIQERKSSKANTKVTDIECDIYEVNTSVKDLTDEDALY